MEKVLEILNNANNFTIVEIEEIFSKYFINHTRPVIDFNIESLYRARVLDDSDMDEKMKSTSDISYPKWETIDKKCYIYNRCSDKGQNFFYGSNSFETIVREVKAKDNKLLVVGSFHFKDINNFFKAQIVNLDLDKEINNNSSLKDFRFEEKKDINFDNLIYNIFKEKVEKDYEDYYKISIAISNILLKNQDINCLKYPSVANNNKMYNYGIKPEFVDKYLFCKDVYVFRVNILSNKLVLTPICHSSNLSPNGEELKFIRFNEFEKDNNFRMYELD